MFLAARPLPAVRKIVARADRPTTPADRMPSKAAAVLLLVLPALAVPALAVDRPWMVDSVNKISARKSSEELMRALTSAISSAESVKEVGALPWISWVSG